MTLNDLEKAHTSTYIHTIKICYASLTEESPAMHYNKNIDKRRQRNSTRNSSGDEIANVNFLYDDIVHALKMQWTLA